MAAVVTTGCGANGASAPASATPSSAAEPAPGGDGRRVLGKTGAEVEAFSLGGEGILRTEGRDDVAVPMILEAIRLGVRYFDTAPAYAGSQDYYGAAFREAGPKARDGVFLASKTHARDRDGALSLLDDSLARLGTDHLDLWQLHDLRTTEDLDAIFSKGGVIEAVERAKAERRIRFVGLTGHADPAILLEAMRRYPFDNVLCPINPADARRKPFVTTVVADARARGMGVVAMKSLAVGKLVNDAVASPAELIRYAASFADTVIVGCKSAAEVRENVAATRSASAPRPIELRDLEARAAPNAQLYDTFKA